MKTLLLACCLSISARADAYAREFSLGVCAAASGGLGAACNRAAGARILELDWPADESSWGSWREAVRKAGPRGDFWLRVPMPAGGVPSHRRLRAAAYLALLEGAEGLLLTAPASMDARLDRLERRLPLDSLAEELRLMNPILKEGRPMAPPFEGRTDLAARLLEFDGRSYLILLNPGPVPAPWPLPAGPRWRPLFETRRDPLELLIHDSGRALIPPGRVLVLEKKEGV